VRKLKFKGFNLPTNKTKAVNLTAAERKEKALELRKQGYSYRDIGSVIGCTNVRAQQIISTFLKEINSRNELSAEDLRTLELEKLDKMEKTLNEQITSLTGPGQMKYVQKALELLLKVQSQRAKLLGIVIPTQVLVPVPTSTGPEKGRVESVMDDPRLVEVVGEAQNWSPPVLALAAPLEPAKETG